MLYYLSLRGFDPRRGVIAEPHRKYSFLLSPTGVFEPDEREPLRLFTSLERSVDADGLVYYISEPNIQKLLQEQRDGSGEIIVDHVRKIDTELLNQTLNLFYEGYRAANDRLFLELGDGYLMLPLIKRKQQLSDFIRYTFNMLYFEGFTIPNVLYALGYMQSCLVSALKEYAILEQLLQDSDEVEMKAASVNESRQSNTTDQQQKPIKNKSEKVLLNCPTADVLQLWLELTDEQLCSALNVPVVFANQDMVLDLLGSIFATPNNASPTFSATAHRYQQLSPGYMNLLCLLMHATYKMNHSYTHTPLKQYCAILKSTFSPFESIEAVQDIVSNISKKVDAVLPMLIQVPSDKAKEALTILKKIGVYRLTL